MHRAVSVEGRYFLPLISRAAGLGHCVLCLDKDAVCGPLLVACVVACTHRPDPHWVGGWLRMDGGVFRGYIYMFNLVNMGISPSCFISALDYNNISPLVSSP